MGPGWLLAIVLGFQAPADPSASWAAAASKAGGFAVKLPAEPVERTKDVAMPDGKMAVVVTFGCQADGATYTITRVPLPVVIPANDRAKFFQGNIQTLLKRSGGAIVQEKAITELGQPGREVIFDATPEGAAESERTRVRMYLFGTNFYTQTISAPKEPFPSKAADAYFASFKFTGGSPMAAEKKPTGGPAVRSSSRGPVR